VYCRPIHGADWLRKKTSLVALSPHQPTLPHCHTHAKVRKSGGLYRKCGFLRPTCVHFKVFEGHKNDITIALKAYQWAVA